MTRSSVLRLDVCEVHLYTTRPMSEPLDDYIPRI